MQCVVLLFPVYSLLLKVMAILLHVNAWYGLD